jgi:hypothetical protein
MGWRYQAGSLIKTEFRTLPLRGRPDLPFDSAVIFEQMKREIAEAEGGLSSGQ